MPDAVTQPVSAADRESMFVNSIDLMNVISSQIEDIVLENGLAVDMYVGFQRFSYIEPQYERYRRLAHICRHIYVWGVADAQPLDLPNVDYIPVSIEDELAREWFVLIDSPQFFTALLAKEMTYGLNLAKQDRRFEGMWTYNPATVSELVARLTHLLGREHEPAAQRDYAAQSRYLAQIYARLVQRQEQRAVEEALVQHRSALFQSGLAASETPLLLLDAAKVVIAASLSACEILGEDADTIIGKPLVECGDGIFTQRDPTQAEPPLMALLRVSDAGLLAANSSAIHNPQGQHIGWVVSLHHSNQRRPRLQRRTLPIQPLLRPYCDRLQQQLAVLTEDAAPSPTAQRVIRELQQVLGTLDEQVQRLALLQEFEAQGEVSKEPLAVDALLRPIFSEERIKLRKWGMVLSLDVAPDLPLLWCDANQVRLALHELLANLVQHAMGCTAARIQANQEHGYINLSVQNNGRGLEPADQERIFGPFARMQPPADHVPVGLGLALARAVVKAHHGHFRIESGEGKGSSFTLMFPARS